MTDQALDALARAQEVRMSAAVVRRAVASGDMTVTDALGDERAASLHVLRLLASQFRWGRGRAMKVMQSVPIRETARVRDLTDRQRDALVEILGDPAAGWAGTPDFNPFPSSDAA